MILLQTDRFTLRELEVSDAPSLARHANNRKIWACVRDRFPHPYAEEDALAFIKMVGEDLPAKNFGIAIKGEIAGVIGIIPQEDVYRYSAEIGYWLGEAYWGKGLMTDILRAFVPAIIERFNLWRLYAGVFHNNPASMRVLEKAGFEREGVLRRAALKDGEILDEVRYGFLLRT